MPRAKKVKPEIVEAVPVALDDTPNGQDVLLAIDDATTAQGYGFFTVKDLAAVNANLIELDSNMLDGQNRIAARVTEAGSLEAQRIRLMCMPVPEATPWVEPQAPVVQPLASWVLPVPWAQPVPVPTAVAAQASFTIESDIPLPPAKRVSRSSYPFDTIAAGQSFFVAGADQRKKLASSVSAANKRFAPKHFEIRDWPGGVRIWRTV